MTVPQITNSYAVGVGSSPNDIAVPVITNRAPGIYDIRYPIGKRWVYPLSNLAYTLTSFSATNPPTANWSNLNSGISGINTLTGDSGGAISPSANNITLAGTSGQIATTGSGSTITWSLSSSLVAPGSLTVTGLLTGDASATINTAGTALNLATDNDSAQVNIGTGTSGRTIDIGTSAAANVITIGSNTAGSTTAIKFATSLALVGATGGTITLGATAQTGTTTIVSSTAANIVDIQNGNNTGTQVLNLSSGTNAANSTVNIMIGSPSTGTQTLNMMTGTPSGGTQVVNLGTGESAASISIGNSSSGLITLTGGTSAGLTMVGSGGTISLFADAAANVITLGSTTASASLTLASGSGGNTLIAGNAAATITLGATAQTGQINIGNSTGALVVDLMNGVAASTQTLNIASGTSATGAQVVNILNGTTPGANTTLNVMNGAASAGTQTVNILALGATRAGVVNIGTGAAAHVVTIGSTSGAAGVTIQSASAGITMTGAIANSSTITSAGNILINGAGKYLGIHHGAVTDFCGTGTLSSGTVTIANTNIATGDIILISRISINGSTTLGEFSYTISNNTSFTVTSLILGTPGSTQTADSSIFAYVIIRPI